MAHVTSYNIWIVLFACLGAYSYGFSFSVFATSIGEPGFYIYFDLDRKSLLATRYRPKLLISWLTSFYSFVRKNS